MWHLCVLQQRCGLQLLQHLLTVKKAKWRPCNICTVRLIAIMFEIFSPGYLAKYLTLSDGYGNFKLLPFCFSAFETLLKSQQTKTFVLQHILWKSPRCAVRGTQIKTSVLGLEKCTLTAPPEFCSQHSHQAVHNCLSLEFQRIRYPLVASLSTCTHVAYTCKDTHINKNSIMFF